MRLLDILPCNSANMPSFSNPEKGHFGQKDLLSDFETWMTIATYSHMFAMGLLQCNKVYKHGQDELHGPPLRPPREFFCACQGGGQNKLATRDHRQMAPLPVKNDSSLTSLLLCMTRAKNAMQLLCN